MSGRRRLARRARAALRQWRATLPTDARVGLALPSWRDQPLVLIGAPVDAALADDAALWTAQLVEYINSHEEVGFYLQERRFHICRAHAAARRGRARRRHPGGLRVPAPRRRVSVRRRGGLRARAGGAAAAVVTGAPGRARGRERWYKTACAPPS